MKHKQVIIIVLLLLCVNHSGLWAQSSVPAAGANASGSGGSASYTVGQIDYSAITGTSGSVNQGVQQPYEFFLVGTKDIPGLSLFCSLYPNPASEHVTLKVTDYTVHDLRFNLSDMDGRSLSSGNVTNIETNIPMGHLPAATYFLTVSNNEARQTFKIIKNQ